MYLEVEGLKSNVIPLFQPWCSTQVDDKGHHVGGQGKWGNCAPGCPIPPDPEPCLRPGADGCASISSGRSFYHVFFNRDTKIAFNFKMIFH